jgi:hypothetical protein
MTGPADLDQLPNAVSSQGATIGRHENLLHGLMEGFQAVVERHDLALDALREQFCGLPTRQPTMTVTSQPLYNSAGSSTVTPVSREPHLPPPERYNGDYRSCQAFLSQCSLVFELQPHSFPSDHSKIAYINTLMSGRVLAWATAVWDQQSSIFLSLEVLVAE